MLFANSTPAIKNPIIMPTAYRWSFLYSLCVWAVTVLVLSFTVPKGDNFYIADIASFIPRLRENIEELYKHGYADRVNMIFMSTLLNTVIGTALLLYSALNPSMSEEFYRRFRIYLYKSKKEVSEIYHHKHLGLIFVAILFFLFFPYLSSGIDTGERYSKRANMSHESNFAIFCYGMFFMLYFHGLSVLVFVFKYWCFSKK